MDHLRRGATVMVAVVVEVTIYAREESEILPLGRKTARVLAEHAALALTLDGDTVVINRDKYADS